MKLILIACVFTPEECSCPFGSQGQTEWADFMEVYELIEKLRKKQQNYTLTREPRERHFEGFLQWLKDNNVNTDAITIEKFPVGGYGLKATAEIQEGAMFLAVPRDIMMTTETAKASILGGLIEDDRILQAMPNIVLALHVLCEYSTPTSRWQPYLKILPSEYSTPLYFTPDEIQWLKASPTLSEMLNQFRNITRQYSYFFKLFQGHDLANKLPLSLKNFCFDDYRWAVSSVMTRQNQIPTGDGQLMISALIPLWDMCNHTNGQITTDFSLENDRSECYTMKYISTGDQVYIFYGSRSNAELLIHNGFVYPRNQCDRLTVKLGVSKNDPLYSMKAEILAKLSMLPSRLFSLHCGPNPVDSDTLAYLRVFTMNQEELEKALNHREQVSKLRDFGEMVSPENEEKAWQFLATRTLLLLKSYPTTAKEDQALLEGDSLNEHCRMAVQLRLCEKNILENTQQYATKQRDLVKDRVLAAETAAANAQPSVSNGPVSDGMVDNLTTKAVMETAPSEKGQGEGQNSLQNGMDLDSQGPSGTLVDIQLDQGDPAMTVKSNTQISAQEIVQSPEGQDEVAVGLSDSEIAQKKAEAQKQVEQSLDNLEKEVQNIQLFN